MDHQHSAQLRCGADDGSAYTVTGAVPITISSTPATAGAGPSAPPINRSSMVALPWRGFWRSLGDSAWRGLARLGGGEPAAVEAQLPWQQAASRRRTVLWVLVVLSALGATSLLTEVLPVYENTALRTAQVTLFGLLFGWVSAGFFTAMMGFWVQLRGDPHALSVKSVANRPIHSDARTAIIMPICNEHVPTVFAGLRATCESLAATGGSKLFDVYVLSDTSDPALRAAELAAWAELRATFGEAGERIHYRWRQIRTKRKAGNVADFCRRWGKNYRYMVVLDADSVMSGDALLNMVRLMEANPRAGIIQTAPQASGQATVHARSQQFASRVAGRLFTAGMQYWQLGESHYWGHNAIIRTAPFIEHCGLAALKGRGGLSGEILSHDFVEAALMRRAGYHVWLVTDLVGSYEQQPPNLLEELQRDRRWCQGNLQNVRLIAEPGLHAVHRAMLLTGALAYLSAPLWLGFVLLGGAMWLFGGYAIFNPAQAVPLEMVGLWLFTVLMLGMPRVLGVATIVMRKEQAQYGGTANVIKSAVLEGALSVLQAPVRMVAHTLFVVVALTGLKLNWKSPPREATDIGWGDAARRFMPIVAVMLVLVGTALTIEPGAALWLAPVGLPLLLAVPLTVMTSRAGFGEKVRARSLMLVPEETDMPLVLSRAEAHAKRAKPATAWGDSVNDPWLFDVVRSAMGPRNTSWGSRGQARRLMIRGLVASQDTDRLSTSDRMRLLSEPQSIVRLRDQLAANARLVTAQRPSMRA
jgi:membrane glycosyltransferase